MSLRSWRIVKAKNADTAFSGNGARRYGGRWNSVGTSVVYTAGSVSLAILEMLVHLEVEDLLNSYVLFEINFDDAIVDSLDPAILPPDWAELPAPPEAQQLGDEWTQTAASAILRVPSVIVPTESNYLVNPQHPAFKKISVGAAQPVQFDPRLINVVRSR